VSTVRPTPSASGHRRHPVPAPDRHGRARGLELPNPRDQSHLEVILLEVDEGRPPVALLGQEIEFVDLPVPEEHLAGVPDDPLLDETPDPQPIADLERALGEADRARTEGDLRVVVEHDDLHPPRREVDGKRQSHRPRAHHRNPVAHRRGGVLIRGAGVGIERRVEDPGHAAPVPRALISRALAAPSQARAIQWASSSSGSTAGRTSTAGQPR
jgi:hypothetical protein